MVKLYQKKLTVFVRLLVLPALIVAGLFIFGQSARAEATLQNTLEYYNFDAFSDSTWLDSGLNHFDINYATDGNIDQGRFGQASRYYPNQQYTGGYSGPQNVHAMTNDGYTSVSFWYKLNENIENNTCWIDGNCGPTPAYKTVWTQAWCTNLTDWAVVQIGKINNEVGYAGDFVAHLAYNSPNSDSQFWFTSSELPRDQAWHNVVIVWKSGDPAAAGNGIWVDGVKDNGTKIKNPELYSRNTLNTDNGCYTYIGPYNIFDVSIDDLAIAKTDITSDQISQLQTKPYGEVVGENPPPVIPVLSNLEQFREDGVTPIAEGDTIYGNAVVLSAMPMSPAGNNVKLEVEVRPIAEEFIGESTASNQFFFSSLFPVSITVLGMANGQYHWQARVIDTQGNRSAWQEMGELASSIDFTVNKTPEIIVPVILAEPKDISHNSSVITAQPCKLIPEKTYQYGHDKEYYQDLLYCVRAYHCENSFGKFNQQTDECENGLVNFKFEIYDNNGGWYKTDRNRQEYYDYGFPGNGKTNLFKDESLAKAKASESALALSNYDSYIFVSSGASFQTDNAKGYFFTSINPEDKKIITSENDGVYAFAHELSHYLGAVFLTGEDKTMLPDLYKMGSTMGWDVMSSLRRTNNDPMFLSSYGKEFLKWLQYDIHDKNDFGDHFIGYLEEKEQNDSIYRYNLEESCSASVQKYYIIEARDKALSTWDSSMPGIYNSNIVLYYVDERGKKEYGYEDVGITTELSNHLRSVSIPGSLNGLSVNSMNSSGVLDPSYNQTFWDFHNLVKITAVNKEQKDGQNGINVSITEILKNSVMEKKYGVVLNSKKVLGLSMVFDGNLGLQNQTTSYPDTDLHLYCNDGRHVGVDYQTGEYEVGVEGAITIGDSQGSPEWIFVPETLKDQCHFVVSSQDTEKFIAENPELAAQIGLDNIKDQYEVYAREIDPVSGILTSATVEKTIEPGKEVEHKISDAGGLEISAGATFDLVSPEILIITPTEINRNVLLNIENLINDADSGVAVETIKIYFDGQVISSQTVDLFSKKLGEHEIKITASDMAGNQALATTKINVVTDISSTIADVNRGYQENLLNQKAKDVLIKDLEGIQKFIERSGQREEKRDQKEQELMAKCVAKKGQAWCDAKLGKIFTKIDYRLSEVNKKILKIQYQAIILKLDIYKKLNWLTKSGYDLIKEDVEYLILSI